MSFTYALCFGLIGIAFIHALKWIYSYLIKLVEINKIKGPRMLPLIGNVHIFKQKYGINLLFNFFESNSIYKSTSMEIWNRDLILQCMQWFPPFPRPHPIPYHPSPFSTFFNYFLEIGGMGREWWGDGKEMMEGRYGGNMKMEWGRIGTARGRRTVKNIASTVSLSV